MPFMNTFGNNPHNPPHVNAGPGSYPQGANYNDPYGQNYQHQGGQPGYYNNANYPNYPPL